jgi:hypothetical protein
VNTRTVALFGYDRDRLVGETVEMLLPEAKRLLGAEDLLERAESRCAL